MKAPEMARLSKQQKFILVRLLQEGVGGIPERYSDAISFLSWDVAEEFNRGHRDRIFDRKIQLEIFKQKSDWSAVNIMEMMLRAESMQDRTLTKKHRTSFSRSLRRLRERGLVYLGIGSIGDAPKRKTIWLTEEGLEVAKELKRRAEDGRYNLEFETL